MEGRMGRCREDRREKWRGGRMNGEVEGWGEEWRAKDGGVGEDGGMKKWREEW